MAILILGFLQEAIGIFFRMSSMQEPGKAPNDGGHLSAGLRQAGAGKPSSLPNRPSQLS
jgi:hypothetical protein